MQLQKSSFTWNCHNDYICIHAVWFIRRTGVVRFVASPFCLSCSFKWYPFILIKWTPPKQLYKHECLRGYPSYHLIEVNFLAKGSPPILHVKIYSLTNLPLNTDVLFKSSCPNHGKPSWENLFRALMYHCVFWQYENLITQVYKIDKGNSKIYFILKFHFSRWNLFLNYDLGFDSLFADEHNKI